MKIAITGGTGFVGSHLAKSLIDDGYGVVLIARGIDRRKESLPNTERIEIKAISTSDEVKLTEAFQDCEAVSHCAGINRELNHGDYDRVHIQGTQNVVNAAKKAGVKKIMLMSYYRARPDCGSRYHETKFQAEEIVRNSGLDYTILKAGMMYGKGDHMLDHLSHAFYTMPLFPLVGFKHPTLAPLAIEDAVRIMKAALVEKRISKQTVAIVGPEKMTLEELAKRVGKAINRSPIVFPLPVYFHQSLARVLEGIMEVPLVSIAQVRMLSEGFEAPSGICQSLPDDLKATTGFTDEQIRRGLPAPGPLTLHDLRFRSVRN